MKQIRTRILFFDGVNTQVVDDFVSDKEMSDRTVKEWMDFEGKGDSGRNSTAPRRKYNAGSEDCPSIREQYRNFSTEDISEEEVAELKFRYFAFPYDEVMRRVC